MRPMRNINWLMLHNGSGFVMKLITPSMMAIVIIVSPVLIFVLYFIFLFSLFFSMFVFFFYVCIFFLHLFFFLRLYIFSTLVFFSTRVVFPGWGCVFRVLGLAFFCWSCFSSFLVFYLLFLFFISGWAQEWLFMLGCVFFLWGLGFWGGPCSMFWLDRLGRARQTCLERAGHDWHDIFS